MFHYYNANPFGRNVDDCTIRAISLATGKTWDETYLELAEFSRKQGITLSEISFINDYLGDRYERFCAPPQTETVKDFLELGLSGTWLVTMSGHSTCIINSTIYDTFDCSDRYIWCVYKVK